jgi:hypothetical protein
MNIGKWLKVCLLFFVSNIQFCYAQFSISAQVPTSGLFTKNQLWNLLIVNSSTRTATVKLQLTLQEPQSRQTLLTAVTGFITIAPGTKIIQYQQAQPVQYNYQVGGDIDRNPAGFLPVGTYQVCYVASEYINETYTELAEECITIEVEPMSPPLLTSPEEHSTGDYHRPSFSWLPPSPIGMFSNLNYDFLLTAVLPGQSVTEAVQSNIPVYSTGSLRQNFLQYPSGLAALDSGKTYAWQIVAKDQSRYAAKSEVWSFTCRKDTAATNVYNAPYIKITNEPSAPSFAYQGIIKAEYYHQTEDSVVTVTIASIDKPGVILKSFDIKVRQGQNFWVYDLGRKIKLQEKQCYEARISISGQQDYMMRFYPMITKQ